MYSENIKYSIDKLSWKMFTDMFYQDKDGNWVLDLWQQGRDKVNLNNPWKYGTIPPNWEQISIINISLKM